MFTGACSEIISRIIIVNVLGICEAGGTDCRSLIDHIHPSNDDKVFVVGQFRRIEAVLAVMRKAERELGVSVEHVRADVLFQGERCSAIGTLVD